MQFTDLQYCTGTGHASGLPLETYGSILFYCIVLDNYILLMFCYMIWHESSFLCSCVELWSRFANP